MSLASGIVIIGQSFVNPTLEVIVFFTPSYKLQRTFEFKVGYFLDINTYNKKLGLAKLQVVLGEWGRMHKKKQAHWNVYRVLRPVLNQMPGVALKSALATKKSTIFT